MLIKANHGNHEGFNRTWSIEGKGTKSEMKELLKTYVEDIYDSYKVVILTKKDVLNYFFDGRSNGYVSTEILNYFNIKNF